MKKIFIVLPLFNDWRSINLLLKKINQHFSTGSFTLNIIIVNDCSTKKEKIITKHLLNIKKIKILNLKKNLGSQKAIYIGLKQIKAEPNSTVVVMDSDGEDDYSKLKKLINKSIKEDDSFIFAKRSKRKETISLRFLNQIRLFLTYILTGKFLNIGNFSAFKSAHLKKLLSNKNLSIAFSSGVIKNFKNICYLKIDKKKRFFGKSKVNLFFLIKHSINIISVFYLELILRTSVFFFLYLFFFEYKDFSIIILSIYLFFNTFFLLNYYLSSYNNSNINILKSRQLK